MQRSGQDILVKGGDIQNGRVTKQRVRMCVCVSVCLRMCDCVCERTKFGTHL